MLTLILVFSVLGSVGALLGAAVLLVFPQSIRKFLLPSLLSYAVGTLLGGAFLGLIPKGIEREEPVVFMSVLLVGFVAFFALEKLLLKRHSLAHEQSEGGAAGPLILIGDAFHNFVDGIVIATAFMTSKSLGITVALAVIAHEIPQEIGEFAILLENGYSRKKSLLLNTLSAVATSPCVRKVAAPIGFEKIGGVDEVTRCRGMELDSKSGRLRAYFLLRARL